MPATANHTQFVVSGFHRSGTSLTMQALVKAGLAVGDHLLPAHPSNPDGHYEDLDVVALHQDALQDNQRDWFSLGGAVQPVPNPYDSRAQSIVERLDSSGVSWGFKDPRSCLFLDWWFGQLTRPVGVFVYRHYLACNRSLRVREAQDLTFSAQPDSVDLRFWKDPHQGLRLWADYNRCLLSFAERHKHSVVVVSYDALISGFNIVEAVNQSFDVSLNAAADSGIRTGAIGLKAADRALPDIPSDLLEELEFILSGLDALSQGLADVTAYTQKQKSRSVEPGGVDTQSGDEQRVDTQRSDTQKVDEECVDGRQLEQALKAAGLSSTDIASKSTESSGMSRVNHANASHDEDLSDWDATKIAAQLDAAIGSFDNERAMRIATLFENEHLDHVKLQLLCGQICLRQGEFERANTHLQRVHTIDPNNRTGLVLQGMLAESQQHYEDGLQIFTRVMNDTPNNVGAYLHAGRCLLALNKPADALATCEKGLAINSKLLGLQLCKLDAMKKLSPKRALWEHFETILSEHPNNAQLLMRYSHWLAEAGESSASNAAYYKAVRMEVTSSQSYGSALQSSIDSIEPVVERQRLQHYVCKELEKLSSLSGRD